MKNLSNNQITEAIKSFRMPRFYELPNVGLYLDQTTKYINSFLSPLGCMEITPSMVSNYVKKGLITNPIKKQYDAEQIAYLFFIAVAKNVLSMENIKKLIELQKNSYASQVAYDYFCSEFENMLFNIFGITEKVEQIGDTSSDAKAMCRSLLIAVSHIIYLHSQFNNMNDEQ
ncbi:MAG: DUF1836 domain-containing protein [Clostridia bacterium]|nr:DUF1836 domain-containing protein [Clostridia bacterium]